MKNNRLSRALSALLALVLLLCLAPGAVLADAPEEETTECGAQPLAPQPESYSITVEEFDDKDGEVTPYDQTTVDEGSYCALSDSENGTIGVNADDSAAQISVGEPVEMGGDDSTLVFGEDFVDPIGEDASFDDVLEGLETEEGYEPSEQNATLDGDAGSEIIGAKAYLSISRNSMVVELNGESKYATLTAVNAPKGSKIKTVEYTTNTLPTTGINSGTILQKGNTCQLFVTPHRVGNYIVKAYLLNAVGLVVDSVKVSVTVCSATLTKSGDVSVYDGQSQIINLNTSGYSGVAEFAMSSNNTTAYKAELYRIANNLAQLKVVGNRAGSGYVHVSLKAKSTGDVLKTISVKVTVTQKEPDTFGISTNVASMDVNASKTITATYTGYKNATGINCSRSNSNVCSATVTKTANRTYSVKITGKSAGTCTVYVNLCSSGGVLTSKAVTVRVGKLPQVDISKNSTSVAAGSYVSESVTLKNLTPGLELRATTNNSAICTCTISGSGTGYTLKILGKNADTTTVTVSTKTSDTTLWSSDSISVTVSAPPPKVTVSSNNLTVNVGTSPYITCSYFNAPANTNVTFSASCTSSSVCSPTWYGQWNSNSHALMFTGRNPGTCTVTVNLINANTKAVLASASVNVTVKAATSSMDLKKLSYSFQNYSKDHITRTLCRKMFGNTQIAENVYNYNIGDGGCCFGMSGSAQLMYNGAVSTSGFGKNRVYDLSKSNTNSSLGIAVSDFVECMHISQVATSMYRSAGVDNVAKTIMEQTKKGYPVLICIFSSDGGHAITAYDYSLTDTTLTVSVYDSNYPGREKFLTLLRSNASSKFNRWNFNLFDSGVNWSGNTDGSICAITFSTLRSVWNSRGKLTSNWKDIAGGANWNLVMTTESDFTLSTLEESQGGEMEQVTVAQLENGELVQGEENVYQSFMLMGATESGETQPVYFMLVPKDYYYVEDNSAEDGISLSIMDEGLSSTVNGNISGLIGVCADQETIAASVSISPAAGESYQVSIGSSLPGQPETISFSGTGNSTNMTLGLTAGGVISADCGEGGTISNIGMTEYAAGDSACYEIVPDEGYVIKAVYVDDENVGTCSSYGFENIDADHTIYAEFARTLSSCTISMDIVSETEQVITVRDQNGKLLEEYGDYMTATGTSGKTPLLLIMAMEGSGYVGSVEMELQQSGELIRSVQLDGTNVNVTLEAAGHNYPLLLTAAVYTSDGQFVGMQTATVAANGTFAALSLADMTLPEGYLVRVLISDPNSVPVSAAKDVK